MSNTTITTVKGVVEHVDPNTIVVEANVRTEATLSAEFVASIRQNGVLTPILARRDEHGKIIVRAGQRRTLAARQAGPPSIPAYIVESDEKTVDRIVQQMAENEHREAVTDADRAAAYPQLAFEGLTPTVIAKRLNVKPATVKAGIAVAENTFAASAIVSHALTLQQAATLIEFEGNEELVAELLDVAENDPTRFAHAAQQARDEKTREEAKAAIEADHAARGFVVLDRERGYYETNYTLMRELVTAGGEPVTVEQLENVDGRAVYVANYYGGEPRPVYYLADPKAAGFRKASGSGATSGPMTDEQKAERKTLIANNKAWASAETVRCEFLVELMSRKTLPKDAAAMIAQGLTHHHRAVGSAVSEGNTLAHTLLGIERAKCRENDKLAQIVEQNPAKAQRVGLAVVLGGIEQATSKNTWRYPEPVYARYFQQLTVWGYTLSDVEHIIVAAAKPDITDPIDIADPVDAVRQDDTGIVEKE